MIGAVCDAIESISLAIGPARVLNFCLAGLFHPARKVRMIYWKIYNTLLFNFQDKMIACYPPVQELPDDVAAGRKYHRAVLDIML